MARTKLLQLDLKSGHLLLPSWYLLGAASVQSWRLLLALIQPANKGSVRPAGMQIVMTATGSLAFVVWLYENALFQTLLRSIALTRQSWTTPEIPVLNLQTARANLIHFVFRREAMSHVYMSTVHTAYSSRNLTVFACFRTSGCKQSSYSTIQYHTYCTGLVSFLICLTSRTMLDALRIPSPYLIAPHTQCSKNPHLNLGKNNKNHMCHIAYILPSDSHCSGGPGQLATKMCRGHAVQNLTVQTVWMKRRSTSEPHIKTLQPPWQPWSLWIRCLHCMLQVLELRVAPCHGTRARCGHRTTPGTLRELKPLPSVKWQQLKWASAKSTRSPQKASSLGGTLQMVRFVCIYHWVYGSMIHCCFKSHPTPLSQTIFSHKI